MKTPTAVAILGAGISGLSVAHALKKEGISVTVFEKKDAPGGVIQSQRENGWLIEQGPNTMLLRDENVWSLFDELQLNSRILEPGPEAKKRFIVRDGQPLPVPMSFKDFLTTDLLSTPAKWQLLKEPFIAKSARKDESIADFIERRMGPEPLNYLANPFIAGIYAGDPDQLSARHTLGTFFEMERQFGSITKGFFKRKKNSSGKRSLLSFDEGLQVLPEALSQSLGDALQLNTEIQKVKHTQTGWRIHTGSHNDTMNEFHAVVSTIPTYQLAAIWPEDASRTFIDQLADITYAPMSVLHLGFKQEDITHPLDGFGMLIPEKEPFSLLGCLFSSSLFSGRAPENHALLTCFIGGARNPELAGQSTEKLIHDILPQLQRLIGLKGKPVLQHHTFWPKAIPQYKLGYGHHLQSMDKVESIHDGLFLTGNYRGGVSIPDCISNGLKMAERVGESLRS